MGKTTLRLSRSHPLVTWYPRARGTIWPLLASCCFWFLGCTTKTLGALQETGVAWTQKITAKALRFTTSKNQILSTQKGDSKSWFFQEFSGVFHRFNHFFFHQKKIPTHDLQSFPRCATSNLGKTERWTSLLRGSQLSSKVRTFFDIVKYDYIGFHMLSEDAWDEGKTEPRGQQNPGVIKWNPYLAGIKLWGICP